MNCAHRFRFATHSFNGWRCCPIPPLYKVLIRQSLLAPFVGGLSLQSVTATLRDGRNIGTRECSNVKPLRLRDTALAALLRYLLRLRCCTPLPLCNTLFQRLSLLSDTSLCPNLICEILHLLAPLTRCEQASLLRWFDVSRSSAESSQLRLPR